MYGKTMSLADDRCSGIFELATLFHEELRGIEAGHKTACIHGMLK